MSSLNSSFMFVFFAKKSISEILYNRKRPSKTIRRRQSAINKALLASFFKDTGKMKAELKEKLKAKFQKKKNSDSDIDDVDSNEEV